MTKNDVDSPANLALEPQDAVTPFEQDQEQAAIEAAAEKYPEINGFNFTLNIPVAIPTPETVEATPIGEAYINHLISVGYMNREEAVAFLTFSAMTAQVPQMVDAFLGVYRKHIRG